MSDEMKIMYLNFYKLTLSQLFFDWFDSKFKINLYHKYFPETFEKYTGFPKLTLLFSISYACINGEAICG